MNQPTPPVAGGSLVDCAPEDLPAALKEHLPLAEAAAARNMAAVKASAGRRLEDLSHQLYLAQTPAVPKASKVIRIRYIAGEWSGLFAPKTACKTRCSHCCNIDVLVPRSEAKLIGKAIGKKPAEPAETFDVEVAQSYRKHVGRPCSFLQAGKCSIYDHRPLMCRALINMDSVDVLCRLVEGVEVPVPYLNTVQLGVL